MTEIVEFFTGLPLFVSIGVYLSGVALFYLVMWRTYVKRSNEKS